MKLMRILVTGGAGFIGSNLVEALLADKHDVLVLDDLTEGKISNLYGTSCAFEQENICTSNFENYLRQTDLIYHLACRKMVYSIKEPLRDLEVNTYGTLRLLEAARKWDVPIVCTSTGSVYGNPTNFPTLENEAKKPVSPYGVSKYFAEEYCRLYHRIYGLRTVIARLHSVYGPKQKAIGVIPKFILQTLQDKPHTIEGNGTQKRCFTYVSDCVGAIVRAGETGKSGETYNVAGIKPYSINEISHMIHVLMEKKRKVEYVNRKMGDLDLTYPSTEKLENLGWKPKTDMIEGLKKTLEWIKNSAPNNLRASL
jgi:UDP-glucose 4-epimerase